MRVRIIHNSEYHPQSQGLVERSIRTLKDILNKNKNLSQLQLNAHMYAINCNEDGEKGSAMSRFMGRATRTAIQNSWQRTIEAADRAQRGGDREACPEKGTYSWKETDIRGR